MYCDGERKLMSMRIPENLIREVERIAKDKGWSFTDVALTALDEYVQWTKNREK